MEGPEIKAVEAVIDNGSFGKRTVRFETGRLAQQADGAVAASYGRRFDGAFHHDRRLQPEGELRLLPAHRGRGGEDVRGRQDPRLVLPP